MAGRTQCTAFRRKPNHLLAARDGAAALVIGTLFQMLVENDVLLKTFHAS
jgi:hypothetical protein